jgi:hypothetical protein
MTRADTQRREVYRAPNYIPRQFNENSRTRFLHSRREQHLARIPGEASDAQIAMVQSLASLEWSALSAERQDTLASMVAAREFRRLHLRVVADFERSLRPQPSPTADALGYAKGLGMGNGTRRTRNRVSEP